VKEESGPPLRPVLDIYDDPWVEWTLRSAGTHLHPGRETATVQLAERALRFGFPTEGTVLEVASALGGPARFVARHFAATVLCLDMNPLMQRALQASARSEGLGLRCQPVLARSEFMPIAEHSLDAAWSQDAMCHMDKPSAVAEVARVLKPGSIFAFTDWIARRRLADEDMDQLARLWGFPSLLRAAEYVALLSACGFDVLLAEDQTPVLAALPSGTAFDQELYEHSYGERWGQAELDRQREPNEAWQRMVKAGDTGFGMFVARLPED
jgi:sarcosine/dimethylglycine N-methyltransferase